MVKTQKQTDLIGGYFCDIFLLVDIFSVRYTYILVVPEHLNQNLTYVHHAITKLLLPYRPYITLLWYIRRHACLCLCRREVHSGKGGFVSSIRLTFINIVSEDSLVPVGTRPSTQKFWRSHQLFIFFHKYLKKNPTPQTIAADSRLKKIMSLHGVMQYRISV